VKQVLYWAWVAMAAIDMMGGLMGWLELRREAQPSARRLAKVLLAGGYRSLTTIVGLYLFGLNVKTETWLLAVGLSAVAYKAYATWGWLLYLHGIINGGGWWGLLKRKK
jgi:hypothetical protein